VLSTVTGCGQSVKLEERKHMDTRTHRAGAAAAGGILAALLAACAGEGAAAGSGGSDRARLLWEQ
jgi:hypothetical protein